jgi:hypothetical protein
LFAQAGSNTALSPELILQLMSWQQCLAILAALLAFTSFVFSLLAFRKTKRI